MDKSWKFACACGVPNFCQLHRSTVKEMDLPSENDFNLLSEENTDFEILLSPLSGKSDDEEVFLGPVGHIEKCVAASINLNCKEEKKSEMIETLNWSPLNTDKFVEIEREANFLAQHFENLAKEKSKEMEGKSLHNKSMELFIKKSKLNLTLLKGVTNSCSPKKMTSVNQSAPLKLHPPGMWNKPEDHSQASLDISLKSPNKKTIVQTTSSSMQPQQNPGDSALLNNIEIAACTETTNVKEVQLDRPPIYEPPKPMTSDKLCIHKPSGLKASSSIRKNDAGVAGHSLNRTSLSTSSLHSNHRTSPPVGRSSSLNMPLNMSNLQAPKNGTRVAAPKTKLSNSTCAATAPNTQLLKPANLSKLSTPGKMTRQGTQTASNQGLGRINSTTTKKVDVPVKSSKAINGQDTWSKAKPFLRAPQKFNVSSPGTARPNKTQPKKPSVCNTFERGTVATTPNKPLPRGMLQTANLSNRRVSMTPDTRQLSGLPTPLNRRLSSIPTFTPRTQPRPGSSAQQSTSNRNRSMSASRAILAGNKQKLLEKPRVLSSPNSSEDEMSLPLVPCILDFSPHKPQTTNQEEVKECAFEMQIKENLLIEINSKNRKGEDHPLIDLSNTPDQKKIVPLKALELLIDFSSPLILLSPADKENVDVNSPLLKF
ncbi:G2 and S phase-expressed protein 1 isoform X2 [Narcine bancroftii]|uniref:G2 and S phase-expressed protein 1 isoform X2 n=1 Tax=Narcine bancroftii TaxID=1343680 RepID=UPI003831B52A